jgi:hypothetical protein
MERKNLSFQDMTITMLNKFDIPKCFWAKTINTSCYVLNCVTLRLELKNDSL